MIREIGIRVGERLGNPKVSSADELSTYPILWKNASWHADFI